ncbi:uncharacterized protein MEPE_03828 [Melanopsichium pennsylvanicum]|uniref:FAS1 domain-containing protein n=2 Tax=Melanopsichium pennsylvanicum TaxID=63383 RepID=A0AAJ4XLP7_9BASI|nr:uncharacterized protein BN887_05726 [Melanopsichium pennsylvanicum 4]SNX85119.1 uncharacterized protein MEPE_03828 [Melanopsichium pennsylvanicum]
MLLKSFTILLAASAGFVSAQSSSRRPLSYAPQPQDVYFPPKTQSVTTLLDFIKAKPELSTLLGLLDGSAGFVQAFQTEPTWDFTFFAPSNDAFENLGEYYRTFLATPRGKWWFGNQMMHHYVPNTALNSTAFNATETRIQTATYQYIGAKLSAGKLVLNGVATVTNPDNNITKGMVHIVDHVLDPSAQIYNVQLPAEPQAFIPGSCSNPNLAYC